MLKSLWISLSLVVWLLSCTLFVAALASWATAGEPVSVASWRPSAAVTSPAEVVDLGVWRPSSPVAIASGPPVSLASWRPPKREVAAAPASSPPAALVTQQPLGYWQQQCGRRGCRLLWVPLQ